MTDLEKMLAEYDAIAKTEQIAKEAGIDINEPEWWNKIPLERNYQDRD